ncbi:two-component system, OmpR family, sensor histidine kinase KdpD [Parapedobacter koreensis]|uniref:histidine kinase n=1 Tax=Parapedobacter koreensis TaxID=332977 RepID=A0A1H7MFS1_9SPHI|nr:two-component system, OmpR family, sensor histidine kinase KdpD [Parapedobacter koreensis]
MAAVKLHPFWQFLIGTASIALLAMVCYALGDSMDQWAVALILLAAVSVLAVLFDIIPVLAAALLSALLLNIFFIDPIPDYKIRDTESALLFFIYLFIALVNAVLTNRLRKQEKKIRDREEKEKTIKLYNTLLNSLSHELKTPIATIIGSIDTLKEIDPEIGSQQRMELLAEMEIAGNRLNKQVENLMNMSRLETGTLKLKRDWCDVNELIFLVIQKLPATDTIRIRFEPDESLPLVKLDGGLIETAVYALVHNATRYTPKQTPIEIVTTYNKENNLLIDVLDSGLGIPETEISHVFEKFYRLPNSGTGGSGLGLSIAKGFVEAHGGTVCVANQAQGGALFRIVLPVEISRLHV